MIQQTSNKSSKPTIISQLSLIYCMILLSFQAIRLAQSNALPFGQSPLSLIAIPPGAYQMGAANPFQAAPMMADSQYDPYSPVQAAPYFLSAPAAFAAPWLQQGLDAHRRSLPGAFRGGGGGGNKAERSSGGQRNKGANQNEEPSDEQKALDGLPLSFIDPDPPSTLTERLSESFSALGEGVKNHFRSISENFSDTMDDIRDAWRPASQAGGGGGNGDGENVSRKRRG